MTEAPTIEGASKRGLLGHPRGLYVLFFTEMWERMSYYGMRALLVVYMTDHLFRDPAAASEVLGLPAVRGFFTEPGDPHAVQKLASMIAGLYTGFVYFTPFFGGMLADRVLGTRRSVVLGGVLMMIGHFLMASERLFFVALFFLVLGNGAFKPNVSAEVGSLYPPGDARRDGAFTLFYMGINLGAALAPIVCGTLGQRVGWHYGFGAAGVGMAFGLVVYLSGQRYLPARTEATKPTGDESVTSRARRIAGLVGVALLSVVFWGTYEQQSNTLQLWAHQRTDWHVLGVELPSTWYQAMNPVMIFALAPLLDVFWARRRERGREAGTVSKMALGCLLASLSFVVMALAAASVPEGARGSLVWLLASTFLLTLGELYLSPIGLSLMSKKAPVGTVSMMMGVWFVGSFFGNLMNGWLGTFYEEVPKTLFFAGLAGLVALASIAFRLLERPLERALA